MVKFLLWCLLFVISWPVAILALLIYPLVWLLSIPFRILGFTAHALLDFLKAILMLPSRLLGGRRTA